MAARNGAGAFFRHSAGRGGPAKRAASGAFNTVESAYPSALWRAAVDWQSTGAAGLCYWLVADAAPQKAGLTARCRAILSNRARHRPVCRCAGAAFAAGASHCGGGMARLEGDKPAAEPARALLD